MELSVEEKAQRYDEAIEQLRAMMPDWERLSYNGKTFLQDLTYILPELQESEDEMIRRVLIQETKGSEVRLFEAVTNEEFIAWLEKKGEQKPTDKAEPKFKVGDWIANDYCVGKIIALTDGAYLLDSEQGVPFSCEHNAHLWTIQDAEDGDVIQLGNVTAIFKEIISINVYKCYCSVYNGEFGTLVVIYCCCNVVPATKEQRNALLKAMTEAGYTFDFDKKDLKKIEDEPDKCEGCNNAKGCVACVDGSEWAHIEMPDLKPYWSEEDEKLYNRIFDIVHSAAFSNCEVDEDGKECGEYAKMAELLKSLKERVGPFDDGYKVGFSAAKRNQWKPSKEQIKAIRLARAFVTDDFSDNPTLSEILTELENQLKKLRKE